MFDYAQTGSLTVHPRRSSRLFSRIFAVLSEIMKGTYACSCVLPGSVAVVSEPGVVLIGRRKGVAAETLGAQVSRCVIFWRAQQLSAYHT